MEGITASTEGNGVKVARQIPLAVAVVGWIVAFVIISNAVANL